MKKIWICLAVVLAAAVVVLAVVLGQRYYNDRYVGEDYYALVPADYDITPHMQYSDAGEPMSEAVDYRLTAYDANGQPKDIEISIFDPSSGWATAGEYLQPGTYLLVKASNDLVTGWQIIDPSEIPASARGKLDAK